MVAQNLLDRRNQLSARVRWTFRKTHLIIFGIQLNVVLLLVNGCQHTFPNLYGRIQSHRYKRTARPYRALWRSCEEDQLKSARSKWIQWKERSALDKLIVVVLSTEEGIFLENHGTKRTTDRPDLRIHGNQRV